VAVESIYRLGRGAQGLAVAAVIVAGIAAVWWIVSKRADIVAAVDPTNEENLANRAANAAFGLDNRNASIGSVVYDQVQSAKTAVRELFGVDELDPYEQTAQTVYSESVALGSCRLAYRRNGRVVSARCLDLIARYGANS